MGRRLLGAAAVLGALLVAGGLEREHRAEGAGEGALLKDRWRLRLAGVEVAEEISSRNYAKALQAYRSGGVLDSDPYLTEVVASVAEPLIAAAKDLYPATADWPWQWHLADTGETNAYCMPGGRIAVLSGLLADEMLGDDRDMLATILAHEVSHAILQHTRESLGQGWVAEGVAWTVAKSLKVGGLREQEMIRGLKTALLDPKSRVHEDEADVLGLELMARAGFDPAKAVTTWQRMADRLDEELRGTMAQRALAFLSDHPSDIDRLGRMRALQPKATPLAAKGKRWEWAVHGIDDTQAELLEGAATAFGLNNYFAIDPGSELVRRVAAAEGIPAATAVEELQAAVLDSGLAQGGGIQMGLSAVVRGVGGFERLGRIHHAWAAQGAGRPLSVDPSLLDRIGLSEEDRAWGRRAVRRLGAFMAADGLHARLRRDLAAEVGKTRPRAAEAIMAPGRAG